MSRYCFTDEFHADGLAIISHEINGNVWLTEISGSHSAPICFFDLSDHERKPVAEGISQFMRRLMVSRE